MITIQEVQKSITPLSALFWGGKRCFFMELELLAKEYYLDCQARNLSPRTIAGYRKQIGYFLRYANEAHAVVELKDLSPALLKHYIVMLQKKGNKPSYINDLIKPIKSMCSYAYQEGYTEGILTKRVKNVKEPRVLIHTFSPDEIKRMVCYFNGSDFLSIRNRLIMMILFDTGIRVSELMDLTPQQIREGYIIIYGKGNKERRVPLNPLVRKWMMKYEAVRDVYFAYRPADNYYFLSKNGKRLTEEAINKFMKIAGTAVGINPMVRVSPHTCRHTFAHQELKNGIDLYSLSRVLGHESITITQRYLEAIQDTQILNSARQAGVLAHL